MLSSHGQKLLLAPGSMLYLGSGSNQHLQHQRCSFSIGAVAGLELDKPCPTYAAGTSSHAVAYFVMYG